MAALPYVVQDASYIKQVQQPLYERIEHMKEELKEAQRQKKEVEKKYVELLERQEQQYKLQVRGLEKQLERLKDQNDQLQKRVKEAELGKQDRCKRIFTAQIAYALEIRAIHHFVGEEAVSIHGIRCLSDLRREQPQTWEKLCKRIKVESRFGKSSCFLRALCQLRRGHTDGYLSKDELKLIKKEDLQRAINETKWSNQCDKENAEKMLLILEELTENEPLLDAPEIY